MIDVITHTPPINSGKLMRFMNNPVSVTPCTSSAIKTIVAPTVTT